MTVVPFRKPPPRKVPPAAQVAQNSKLWYLLIVPAFMIGCLLGMLLFAMLPGILIIEFIYGSESYHHPELIGEMMRPGMLLGGFLSAFGIAYFILKVNLKEWL